MSDDPKRAQHAEEPAARLARSFRNSLAAAAADAPTFEEVAAYAEDRLHGAERELFDERLAGDPLLRAEVQDLRDLRAEMGTRRQAPRRFSWIGLATAASLFAAMMAATWWMRLGRAPAEPARTTATRPPEQEVARLRDQAGTIALLADGTIEGLSVSRTLTPALVEAMRSGQVQVPALRPDLAVSPVTAMGASGPAAAFAPLSPLSTLVRSDTPVLRFTPHARARGYVVSVYDLNLEQVASSPLLDTTEWTPDRPLPRGRTYLWQIEARTPEGRVAAPAPPAPEARFHVASAEIVTKVDEAAGTGSHLAAGVALAEAGFLDEAVAEFEKLATLNPDSAEVKKLLEVSRASRPRR